MLKRIYIDNYKCFSNFEFVPGPLTLLMGRNGSGKSSLFEVLRFLGDFALGADIQELNNRTRTRWDTRSEQTFELEGEFKLVPFAGSYKYRLVIDHLDSENSKVSQEELEIDGVRVLSFADQQVSVLRDDGERLEYPGAWTHSAIAKLPALSGPIPGAIGKTYLRPLGFREWLLRLTVVAPDPHPDRMIAQTNDRSSWRLDRYVANFASWYRRVLGQQMERQHEFDLDLASAFANFSSISFEPIGRSTYELGVKVKSGKTPTDTYTLTLDELSDGQRVLMALYALLRFVPGDRIVGGQTLWIDEPDNFVSLAEIQPWLIALRERVEAGDGFQALITSHHPEVINYLAADCGQVLERERGGPVRARHFTLDPTSGLTPAETVARDRA
jgi:predicted ATPase